MKRMLTRGCTLLLFGAAALAAQSSGRAFQPEDWYKIARVGGGTLSPDGYTLAFTVGTVLEDKDTRHSEVWIQPVSGGVARRMTAPGFESTAPRWSDDGKTLYFTSTRPGSRGTTWAVRMDEGGEALPAEAPGGGAAGGRGGRGGRGGGGGNAGAQPADKSFTITAGAGTGGRAGGGRGGRGAPGVAQAGAPDPNDPTRRWARSRAHRRVRSRSRSTCGAV